MMWLIWAPLTGLTAWIAWTDGRERRIPNGVSALAAGLGLALMVAGIIPWTHLWWAGGMWLLFETIELVRPDRVGSGDIKWAVIIMGWLGAAGLLVITVTQGVAFIWGAVAWWGHHRVTRWSQMRSPWGPGFLFGLLTVAGGWWWIHG